MIDSATSESLINILAKEIFARYGLPTSIHADNGSQFISVEFKTFLDSCSISLTHSSKYNPRGNGQNERYNGELQRVMTRILRENGLKPDHWELVVANHFSFCIHDYAKPLEDRHMTCSSISRDVSLLIE